MAFKNKSMTIGAAIFCLGTLVPAVTGAYAISPMEIYRQARQQNEVFLQKLSRYRNAFDMQDKDGNTAYCIALRYNDVSAQEILEKYGADTGHSCVESIEREKEEKARRAERNAAAKRRRFRSSEGVFADSGNNYLWWGWAPLPSAAELQHWPEAEEAAAAVKYTGRRERMARFIWEQENPAVR